MLTEQMLLRQHLNLQAIHLQICAKIAIFAHRSIDFRLLLQSVGRRPIAKCKGFRGFPRKPLHLNNSKMPFLRFATAFLNCSAGIK
jgi:hypothetical protein